ncbi:ena/VASP-like protein isoform X3 [Hydra vulgaris]|uniref:Ena/VASP-like protein isoform X3 n=1 Tax=Hydra vulgaris TaxID=6087 RepID=A0ABM4CGL0_HYDVU
MSLKKKKSSFFSRKKHSSSTESLDVDKKDRSFSIEYNSKTQEDNISVFRTKTLSEIEKYVNEVDPLENKLNKNSSLLKLNKEVYNAATLNVTTKPKGEHSVAQARASVMIYNNDLKKWEHAGGSQGVSRVHVYFNPSSESYRIVGRKVNDNEVVINCLIAKNLKYNKATATFHQWRDQRQVYGLNFVSPEDASTFSEAVLGAIDYLSNPESPPLNNSYDSIVPTQKVLEDPYVNQQQNNISLVQKNIPVVQQQAPVIQPQVSVQQTTLVVKAQQSAPEPPPAPPVPAIVSAVPPSVPAPPPPTQSLPNTAVTGGAPIMGGVPPPPIGGGPPPPPPPPPPPAFGGPSAPPPPPLPGAANKASGSSSSASGGGSDLSNALAGVTLKKRAETSVEERRPTISNANPMDDMMSALNRKLLARKQKADGDEDVTDAPSTPFTVPVKAPVNKNPPVSNNKATVVTTAAKNKLPTQVKESLPNGVNTTTNVTSLSSEDFKLLKEELLSCLREEINAAKNEIIEAIREEMSRSS